MTITEILILMPPSAPIIIALIVPTVIGCVKVFRLLDEVVLTLEAKRLSMSRDTEMKQAITNAAKAIEHLATTQADHIGRRTIYPND